MQLRFHLAYLLLQTSDAVAGSQHASIVSWFIHLSPNPSLRQICGSRGKRLCKRAFSHTSLLRHLPDSPAFHTLQSRTSVYTLCAADLKLQTVI